MPARPRPALLLLTSAALALGLAACADQDDPQVVPAGPGSGTSEPATPSTSPSGTTGTGAAVAADLTITVDDGTGATSSHTLTCEPAGGDVADPDAACAALASAWPAAFQPVPKDRACTMVFGGPEKATVTGTVGGETVLAELNRTNGCEIDRWTSLEPLLGPVGNPDS